MPEEKAKRYRKINTSMEIFGANSQNCIQNLRTILKMRRLFSTPLLLPSSTRLANYVPLVLPWKHHQRDIVLKVR